MSTPTSSNQDPNFFSTPVSTQEQRVALDPRVKSVNPSNVRFPDLNAYSDSISLRLSPGQTSLQETINAHTYGAMSSSPMESQFIAWLAKTIGAKKVLEVGVFLGATTLALAEVLPADGKIVAMDVSTEFCGVAAKHWESVGVQHKIDLRIAPASDTLKSLSENPSGVPLTCEHAANLFMIEAGTYDLAFIDADKANYDTYYEYCLKLVRPGGIVAVDNVYWHGRILDDSQQDADTVAIRAINKKIHTDKRVDISVLPVADGLTLARKL